MHAGSAALNCRLPDWNAGLPLAIHYTTQNVTSLNTGIVNPTKNCCFLFSACSARKYLCRGNPALTSLFLFVLLAPLTFYNPQLCIIKHNFFLAIHIKFNRGNRVVCSAFHFDNFAKAKFLVFYFLSFFQI